MDSKCHSDSQVKEIVSPSLLPQEWEMDDVRKFFDPRFAFMDSEWLPRHGYPEEDKLQESDIEGVKELVDNTAGLESIESEWLPLQRSKKAPIIIVP